MSVFLEIFCTEVISMNVIQTAQQSSCIVPFISLGVPQQNLPPPPNPQIILTFLSLLNLWFHNVVLINVTNTRAFFVIDHQKRQWCSISEQAYYGGLLITVDKGGYYSLFFYYCTVKNVWNY